MYNRLNNGRIFPQRADKTKDPAALEEVTTLVWGCVLPRGRGLNSALTGLQAGVTCGAEVAPPLPLTSQGRVVGAVSSGAKAPTPHPAKQAGVQSHPGAGGHLSGEGREESWLVNGNIFNFPGLLDDSSCSISPFLSLLYILLSLHSNSPSAETTGLACTLGIARQ